MKRQPDEEMLEMQTLVAAAGEDADKLHASPHSRQKRNKLLWLAGIFMVATIAAGIFMVATVAAVMTRSATDDSNVNKAQLVEEAFEGANGEATASDSETAKLYQELAKKTPLPLPLQPPYRIVEAGQKRSGTTFQFHLLHAIAQIKSQGEYQVEFMGYVKKSINFSQAEDGYPESFVAKSHNLSDRKLAQAQREGKLIVFTSGFNRGDTLSNVGLHHQLRYNLESCSMCEIDKYQPIFGLTDKELQLVKDYMSAYEKIRQCCGLQMAHAERFRLKGCPVSRLQRVFPNYPHCELVDKQQAEQDIMSFANIIEHRANSPKDNWQEPGDCARFDAMIASGMTRKGHEEFNVETDCP